MFLLLMALHFSAYIKFPGVFTHITLISNSFVYQVDVRTESITKTYYNIDKDKNIPPPPEPKIEKISPILPNISL